jgi:CDP-paratose 2-epimerase
VNVRGTLTVLEAMRSLKDKPFLLFTSTNKVYGSIPDLPLVREGARWVPRDRELREHGLSEERSLDFCTPYGCSKGAADQYVLDYAKSFGLDTVVFRMSCIYGPHQNGTEDQGWVAHFAIQSLQGEPITVYGDGSQVRDLLYVEDLVDAMLLAHEHRGAVAGHAFNMGGGPRNAVSVCEVLERMNARDVAHEEVRVGDQRYYVADTERFRAATGWTPLVDVEDGIDRLVQWLAPAEAVA